MVYIPLSALQQNLLLESSHAQIPLEEALGTSIGEEGVVIKERKQEEFSRALSGISLASWSGGGRWA